jgi:hypothetical protein
MVEQISQWIEFIVSISTLIGIILIIYKFSNDPDIRTDKQLGINAAACEEKHRRIDEIISEMRDRFVKIDMAVTGIKENDLKHIEQEMRKMSQQQTKILTVLEYREGLNIKK